MASVAPGSQLDRESIAGMVALALDPLLRAADEQRAALDCPRMEREHRELPYAWPRRRESDSRTYWLCAGYPDPASQQQLEEKLAELLTWVEARWNDEKPLRDAPNQADAERSPPGPEWEQSDADTLNDLLAHVEHVFRDEYARRVRERIAALRGDAAEPRS